MWLGRQAHHINAWMNRVLSLLWERTETNEPPAVVNWESIISTANAGEHALTMSLALKMRMAGGYTIEPFHFVDLVERHPSYFHINLVHPERFDHQHTRHNTHSHPVDPHHQSNGDNLSGSCRQSALRDARRPADPGIARRSVKLGAKTKRCLTNAPLRYGDDNLVMICRYYSSPRPFSFCISFGYWMAYSFDFWILS